VETASVRPPAVSGAFYESDPARLRRQIEWCFDHPKGPGRRPRPWGSRRVIGLVVPHAGLMFSGPVAACAYLRMAEGRRPGVVIIVGPDHWGRGPAVALSPHPRWRTPLGDVPTVHEVVAALRGRGIAVDGRGHAGEHSVEVQLPFVQFLAYGGPVVPIVMAEQDAETAGGLAEALADALGAVDGLLIASSDLSHYVPHEQAMEVDRSAIDAVVARDPRRLLDLAARRHVTMCGAGPVAAVLEAAGRLGAERVDVLQHATSADTGGDHDSVVGYAAVALEAA
jgi:AmmeMemoRadiSam system protein B